MTQAYSEKGNPSAPTQPVACVARFKSGRKFVVRKHSRNRFKPIVCSYFSAQALQTILVLTGAQDLYKRWADKSNDFGVDWNIDAAKKVLEAWQRSFTNVNFLKTPGPGCLKAD